MAVQSFDLIFLNYNMRRSSKNSPRKLSGDSQQLAELVRALILASSHLEERAWEREIETLLYKLLKNHHQEPIDAALEQLLPIDPDAYDLLMDMVEACSESATIEYDGRTYDGLLIAIPSLAWTRFSIGSGPVSADLLALLNTHLHTHILAPDVHTSIAPTLYAIDQLPRSHADTYALMQQLTHSALTNHPLPNLTNLPPTAPFLADTRYLLVALVVSSGMPLFRWQLLKGQHYNSANRVEILEQWRAQATPNFTRLLPGCGVELLLPAAYYSACREADQQIRPTSVRAACYYLSHTLGCDTQEFHASIGRFGEQPENGRIDEYRIGFSLKQSNDVIYGVVWPLYGLEEVYEEVTTKLSNSDTTITEPETPLEQILSVLRESGISHIQYQAEFYAMEFCEDCGSPLYPNQEGDLMHPEMPEDTPTGSMHLH